MPKPKLIHLTQNKFVLVDRGDYFRLILNKWSTKESPNGRFYAVRSKQISKGKEKSVYMHREIMGVNNPKTIIDHKDGNGLNNQRSNLRIATHSQNRINSPKCKNKKSSVYVGVYYESSRNKWRASIFVNGKNKHIGYFMNEIDAAKAYNEVAIQHFGEFVRPNYIP